MITWFSAHLGTVLWDLFLVALTIGITVFVIDRSIERREESRWVPARNRAYFRVLFVIPWLMNQVPDHRRSGLRRLIYRFGSHSVSSFDYGADFMRAVSKMDLREFEPVVAYWCQSAEQITQFQQIVERLSEPEIAVFMAREPELGRLIGVIRERVLQTTAAFRLYYQDASEGRRGRQVGLMHVDTMEQACIRLREIVFAAYYLIRWLGDQADSVEPYNPRPQKFT
jgi:hypothetical protein